MVDLNKFLVKAEQALRKRNVPQAIALFKQVIVASPGNGPARAGLLAAYRRRVELKGGPSLLDRVAARSLRAAAAGLAGARQAGALVKTCEAGLEKDPTDAYLASRLAAALEQLDRPEEALATWEHRLSLDEQDVEALKSAGKLHYALRQVTEAVSCLDRAHALAPHDPEVEKLRKHLAAEGTLADTHYQSATSSRDVMKDPTAMARAERAQRRHKSTDELAQDVQSLADALAENPLDLDLRRRLARLQIRLGTHGDAVGTARAGLEHHPDEDSLLDIVGDAELGRRKAARKAAEASGDAEAVARCKLEQAEYEVEEFGRRVRLTPGNTALRISLARACYRAGQTETAIEHFQAAVEDPRVELDARQGLGVCFFRKGLFPLAERQFSRALERAGGVGGDRGKEICYHLGLVCERQGDTPGALARFMEIYEVDIHYKDVARKIEDLSS